MSASRNSMDEEIENMIEFQWSSKHEELIISGFIRENYAEYNKRQIVSDDIQRICKSFWGSFTVCFCDKLIQKSISLQKEIDGEMRCINERTKAVEAELEEAKPTLEAAQKALWSINKKHLNCIKALRNPPKFLEMALNATVAIIGTGKSSSRWSKKQKEYRHVWIDHFFKQHLSLNFKQVQMLLSGYFNTMTIKYNIIIPSEIIKEIMRYIDDGPYDNQRRSVKTPFIQSYYNWRTIQRVIASNDFMPRILKYDTNKMKEKTRKKIKKEFLANPDFTYERVNKSSKVGGPLVLWVKAQIKFAHVLDSVEPMTKEIKELKEMMVQRQGEAEKLQGNIRDLEKLIAGEY